MHNYRKEILGGVAIVALVLFLIAVWLWPGAFNVDPQRASSGAVEAQLEYQESRAAGEGGVRTPPCFVPSAWWTSADCRVFSRTRL